MMCNQIFVSFITQDVIAEVLEKISMLSNIRRERQTS